MSADSSVIVRWTGTDDVYEGGKSGKGGKAATGGNGASPPIMLDSDGLAAPSPIEALLVSLGACMCIDIRMILEKSRVTVTTLEARMEGDRAEKPPRRFTAIRMIFEISGPGPDDDAKIERAIALSRETYCSVLHSLDRDVAIETRFLKV